MIDHLRKQVEVLTSESVSRGMSNDSGLVSDADARSRNNDVPTARSSIMKTRIIPDFDKSVDRLTGRESSQVSD